MERGAIERRRREHNERAWLAWNTANLSHYVTKRMPSLRTLLIPESSSTRRRQSSAEQLMIVRALHAAFNRKKKGKNG